jgi:hypothetical protein
MPGLNRLWVVFLAAASLAAAAPLRAQFASRPAMVQLVAQLPPTVGVSWTLQGLKLPQAENLSASVLVLRSSWVLAKGHTASYECRLEGSPPGGAQLIALRKADDPHPPFQAASFLPHPAETRLSLLQKFLPQRGQHLQDDCILVLTETSVTAERSTLRVRIVVL